MMTEHTDDELKDLLRELDESDENLNEFEIEFIESVGFNWHGPLTENQRSKAEEILEEYDLI